MVRATRTLRSRVIRPRALCHKGYLIVGYLSGGERKTTIPSPPHAGLTYVCKSKGQSFNPEMAVTGYTLLGKGIGEPGRSHTHNYAHS